MTVQHHFESFQEAAQFARTGSANLGRDLIVRRAPSGQWAVLCEDGTPIEAALLEVKQTALEIELAQAHKKIGVLSTEVEKLERDLAQHKKWLANAHADLDRYMPREETPPAPSPLSGSCNACDRPFAFCICSR